MLVYALNFDKVETQLSKTITTTNTANTHERFFNYEIMDFNVVILPRLVFNSTDNCFRPVFNEWYQFGVERELEKEIKLIKEKVPYAKRRQYMI